MCIHFRARGRFPRADRLPPAPPWFREAWKIQITLCSWTLRSRRIDGFHRGEARKETGGSSFAMLAPHGGRLGPGRFLPVRVRCTSLGIFCTVRFSSAGFVTALSDRFRSGGRFPAGSFIASILPGPRLLDWPVKCPLYARAIDIFLGLRLASAATAPCRLPGSRLMNLLAG